MSLHTPPPWSVFRELNYTPLERDRGERTECKKRDTETEKNRDREKMEFGLPCVASRFWNTVFWQCKEQTSGPSTQMEQELQYHMLPWQQLNQLMMWGSLIVTNTVTETWLSSCLGKSTQSTYRPILFPWFTVPLSVQLPNLAAWRTGKYAVLLCPVWSDLCKSVWDVWSGSDL